MLDRHQTVDAYDDARTRSMLPRSAARTALSLDIDGIDGLAGGHEQTIPFAPTKTEVGTAFRQQDTSDQRAVGGEHGNAVLVWSARKTAPDVACGIATNSVGVAWHPIEEHPAVHRPAGDHVVNMRRLGAARRVDHVKPALVGREAQPVRTLHIADRDTERAAAGVEPIHTERQFRGSLVAKIVTADTSAIVTEPDRSVGLRHHVVWAGQPGALERGRQNGDGSVMFGARDGPAAKFAGDQAALPVARVAV